MVPESPRFLVIRGRIDDARASLARLRSTSADSEEVNTELEEIRGNYEYELSLGDTTYIECFRGKMCPYICRLRDEAVSRSELTSDGVRVQYQERWSASSFKCSNN